MTLLAAGRRCSRRVRFAKELKRRPVASQIAISSFWIWPYRSGRSIWLSLSFTFAGGAELLRQRRTAFHLRRWLDHAQHLGHSVLVQAQGAAARGALLSAVLVGLGTILAYAIQIFISRTLGAAEFGTYAYVLALLNIVRTVVCFSLDMAALRFASTYFTSGNWPLFQGFLLTSRRTVAVLSIAGAIVCCWLTVSLRHRLEPALFHALLAGSLLVIPTALLTLEVALLQALRLVYQSRVPFTFVRPLVIAFVLFVATFALHRAGTATLALLANLVGVMVALAISYQLMGGQVPAVARDAVPARQTREWSQFCLITLGQNILYLVLSQQADVVIVGSAIGTTEAGYYAAASQIAAIILLGVVTVNQYFAPILAEFHARPTDSSLKDLLSRIMLLNAALSLPLVAAIVVFGPFLLGLFGPGFAAAYPVIVILAVGCLVSSLWGYLWGDLLTMAGFHRESAAVVIVVVIVNLALTLVLTPRLGITGAAYATTAAVVLRCALVAIVVHRKFGFWPWTIWRAPPPLGNTG
jgi:O-antigen/teichoic acid export membrane protein